MVVRDQPTMKATQSDALQQRQEEEDGGWEVKHHKRVLRECCWYQKFTASPRRVRTASLSLEGSGTTFQILIAIDPPP